MVFDPSQVKPSSARRLSRATRIRQALLLACISVGCLTGASTQTGDSDQTVDQPATRRQKSAPSSTSMAYGRRLVKCQHADQLVTIGYDELPRRIKLNMCSAISLPAKENARPFKISGPPSFREEVDASVLVYAARHEKEDDLVEYRWKHQEKTISVLASRNAQLVRFDLDMVPECKNTRGQECAQAVKRWVAEVIKLKGADRFEQEFEITFPWPAELQDGAAFSSAPDFDIDKAWRWHYRIDALVEQGVLDLLIYRQNPQVGFQKGDQWFDDALREEVHRRMGEDSKRP